MRKSTNILIVSIVVYVTMACFVTTSLWAQAPQQGQPATSPQGSTGSAITDSIPDAYMVLRAMAGNERVVLRWSHSNSAAWSIGKDVGYRVERAVYDDDEDVDNQAFQTIGPDPLMPWPLDRYTEQMVRDNNLLGIVGQALHGPTFEVQVSTSTIAGILQRARETERRYVYSLWAADLDSASAEALGVRLVDDDVVTGETYVYRVSLVQQDSLIAVGDAYTIETALVDAPPLAPEGFEVSEGDGAVELAWSKEMNSMVFSGFWIERSDDGGQTFRRVNEAPITGSVGPLQGRFVFPDTALVNYVIYHYRLIGITHFGTLSPPAELTAVSRDVSAPDPPVITGKEHVRGATIRLEWELVEGSAIPSDFDAFYIGHSSQHGGPYEFDMDHPLLNTVRGATDDRARPTQLNYYVVASVDTAGNAAPSLPVLVQLNDSIPPAAPTNLRLTTVVDTAGQIIITWDHTGEIDLYAYRVYRKHHVNDRFVLRNDVLRQDTTWVDTLNVKSLASRVYYQVVALDYSYNASDPSAELEVKLPDILPPVTPVFTRSTPSDSTVSLAWARSPSADVQRQVLFRRTVPAMRWDSLRIMPAEDSVFIDFNVERLRTYEYTLQVTDSTGLHSDLALPVKSRVYDTGVRPGVENFLAAADTAEGFVRLSWSYPNPAEGEYFFIVYRGLDGGEPMRYRSAGTATVFEDRRVAVRSEGSYSYAVMVHYKNGAISPLGSIVTVPYPRR